MLKLFLVSSILLLSPLIARAGFLDGLGCVETGACTLNDIALGFTLLIKMMLGAMGAVALIYFVYGGAQWLISAGRAERVKKGKDIMINTVFALIVAFGGFIFLDFFVNRVLNVDEEFQVTSDAECIGANANQPCGTAEEVTVCTGRFLDPEEMRQFNELCLSKCTYEGLVAFDVRACIVIPPGSNPVEYISEARFQGATYVAGSEGQCPTGQACISYHRPPYLYDVPESE